MSNDFHRGVVLMVPSMSEATQLPLLNAWVTHPAANRALPCLTSQFLLHADTLRVAVKASSYSEVVCVSFILVIPITPTPLPPFFFQESELSLHELVKHFPHHCSTDGTQHDRNYPVAPAPIPGSLFQLLTPLCVTLV